MHTTTSHITRRRTALTLGLGLAMAALTACGSDDAGDAPKFTENTSASATDQEPVIVQYGCGPGYGAPCPGELPGEYEYCDDYFDDEGHLYDLSDPGDLQVMVNKGCEDKKYWED